jgi:hypothetical protein
MMRCGRPIGADFAPFPMLRRNDGETVFRIGPFGHGNESGVLPARHFIFSYSKRRDRHVVLRRFIGVSGFRRRAHQKAATCNSDQRRAIGAIPHFRLAQHVWRPRQKRKHRQNEKMPRAHTAAMSIVRRDASCFENWASRTRRWNASAPSTLLLDVVRREFAAAHAHQHQKPTQGQHKNGNKSTMAGAKIPSMAKSETMSAQPVA